jgi:hypothetical protein
VRVTTMRSSSGLMVVFDADLAELAISECP